MSHTILLVQPVANKASRTYSDFETVPQAVDGVLALFEKRLKELNPQMRQITYDINDLYRYIDTLQDLSALVFASGAWSSCATQPTGTGLTTGRASNCGLSPRLQRLRRHKPAQ